MKFRFRGGIRNEDQSHTEKFLLFVVADGEEMYFHQARQHGLIIPEKEMDWYKSRIPYVKIFCYETRFGARKMHYNFVVRLDADGADITLKGFGLGAGGFIFQAKGELIKKENALPLFKEGSISRSMLEKQSVLPKLLAKQMKSVIYSEQRISTRKIRV